MNSELHVSTSDFIQEAMGFVEIQMSYSISISKFTSMDRLSPITHVPDSVLSAGSPSAESRGNDGVIINPAVLLSFRSIMAFHFISSLVFRTCIEDAELSALCIECHKSTIETPTEAGGLSRYLVVLDFSNLVLDIPDLDGVVKGRSSESVFADVMPVH